MKTSNKIALTALVFLLASLAAYNMALKKEYNKGAYKDPYKNFTALSFQDFEALEVNPAHILNVKVSAGPYAVWVRNDAAEYVQVKQIGKRLRLDAIFPEEREYAGPSYAVMISCPRLSSLATNAMYSVKGKLTTDKASPSSYAVTVAGFDQDSLRIQQDNASSVKLIGNAFRQLHVVAGLSSRSSSAFYVMPGNQIASASFDIRNKSQLVLDNVSIPKLRYQFADSTKATISGSALAALTRLDK
ncbi:DUF2807 domain-containing protein [Hymenobacter sp. HDW8]|uniref:DUF2807 domain-containing protein n=1 Tax=Hymenobacter sp. HDW8 TaxID=2714932 RepID=UPI00140A814A|nr:DUF2807 domain-containing protein [Hymenobacter sp. HDW8]QIL76703.1 hypothetical protein G7064_13180 [Hymenobacter sp. HDW8]